MAAGGNPQSKQASSKLEQHVTALWGRSPEGPCCFRVQNPSTCQLGVTQTAGFLPTAGGGSYGC